MKMRRKDRDDYLTNAGFLVLWMLILFASLVTGCSRPNPTPELNDPIYLDLVQRSSLAKAAAETAKEEIKTMREELENLPARDTTRRKLQQDLSRKETHLMVADQEVLYFEIRAQQRKAYARDEYNAAFKAGRPWPDPKDFEAYKLQRQLQNAPREWNSRLKKTDRYNKKSPDELRKELDEKLKASAPAH